MEKKIWESKGIWGGVLVAFGGVAVLVGQLLQGTLDLNSFLTQVIPLFGTGLGILGIRFAVDK